MQKKIISLICALTMVFSMFSAISVSAAGEKGIALSGSLSNDGKTITIDVNSVGVTGFLRSFFIVLNAPEGIVNSDLSYVSQVPLATNLASSDNTIRIAFLDFTGDGVVFKDNHLVTIKVSLSSPLSYDYTATLQGDSSMEDQDGEIIVKKGTMDAASVTIKKWSGT